jgi:hypothetical protein
VSVDDLVESAPDRPAAESTGDLGWFQSSTMGRGLLSIVLMVLVACVIGWNLPGDSSVRDDVRSTIEPVVHALGIDQGWAVFAPNPSKTSVVVEAEVTFADGSTALYQFPSGDAFIGGYREYRWRKLERRFRTDNSWTSLRAPTTEWIASQFASPEHPVTEVALVRHLARTPELTSGDDHVYEREEFYKKVFDPPVDGTVSEDPK